MNSMKWCYRYPMFVPVLLFALVAPSQDATKPDTAKGAYLFHACQAAVREADHPRSGSSDVIDVTICLSYIEGFMDGGDATGRGLCSSAPYATDARVYVTYMEKHPKLMNMDKRVGFLLAIGDAYPCPAKQ